MQKYSPEEMIELALNEEWDSIWPSLDRGISVNIHDSFAITLAIAAASSGHADALERLIERGAYLSNLVRRVALVWMRFCPSIRFSGTGPWVDEEGEVLTSFFKQKHPSLTIAMGVFANTRKPLTYQPLFSAQRRARI